MDRTVYLLHILCVCVCVCVCVNRWFLIIRIIYCTQKNTEALKVTSKEIGLEVNAENGHVS